jgi:hypothetical protein
MRIYLSVVLLVACSSVGAEELYRCVDRTGLTMVQQVPCAAGMKSGTPIHYERQIDQPIARVRVAPTRIGSATDFYRPARASTGRIAQDRCVAARKFAQDERERLGLHATFDQLRALQDRVYERCKDTRE